VVRHQALELLARVLATLIAVMETGCLANRARLLAGSKGVRAGSFTITWMSALSFSVSNRRRNCGFKQPQMKVSALRHHGCRSEPDP
jgi:hypothetical protein